MPSSNDLRTQLLRALNHAQGTQPDWRIHLSTRTTRDQHPTKGTIAIVQAATSGSRMSRVTSLNVRHSDGSQGKLFCWGIQGFGWGQGEWEDQS